MTPFAEWNKEAFFFFLPTLYPFLRIHFSTKKSCFILFICVLVAGFAYLPVRLFYANNPGPAAAWHLPEHLKSFFHLRDYFRFELNYGVLTSGHMFFGYLISWVWLLLKTWKSLPQTWKQHLYLVSLIQLPLYWTFCVEGEVRNLSFFYPFFCTMIILYLRSIFLMCDDRRKV